MGYDALQRVYPAKATIMSTAIVGVGSIGGAIAHHLVTGGESVVLASKDESKAVALADSVGALARAASFEEAVKSADAIVFAVWLDTMKELIMTNAVLLENKIVVDPSNPLGFDANGK